MSRRLSYRGYEGSVLYSSEDQLLHGRMLGLRDMVTFEGADVIRLEANFRSAVDEYLAFCAAVNKMPDVPRKQATRVRVSPELRDRAVSYAQRHHRKLNAVVREALEGFLAVAE